MIAEQIGGRASEQFFDARRYFRQGGGISGHLVQMLGATVQAHMTHGRLRDCRGPGRPSWFMDRDAFSGSQPLGVSPGVGPRG